MSSQVSRELFMCRPSLAWYAIVFVQNKPLRGIISEWVRHLMSQRLLRKMKERQTAWELPRVIATCTVPKKMRPEDLPKFREQRLVIELRLAYLSVCKLYLCLRSSNRNGGRSWDRWLLLLTSCCGIRIRSSYIALMSAFSTTLVFWISPHPIS